MTFCGKNFLTLYSQSKNRSLLLDEFLVNALLEEFAVRLHYGVALIRRRVQEYFRYHEILLVSHLGFTTEARNYSS